MIKSFVILLAALTWSLSVFSQSVNKVAVKSAKCDCSLMLNDIAKSVRPPFLSDSAVAERVMAELWQRGYVLAAYDSVAVDNSTVVVWVSPGEKFVWGGISYSSDVEIALTSEGYQNVLSKGASLSAGSLNTIFKTVLNFYENNGYPFAAVKLDSVVISGNSVSAVMKVEKNNFVKIDTLEIEADFDISPYYIFNVTGIYPRDVYSQRKIDDIVNRLKTVGFFSPAKNPVIGFSENSAVVRIYLKKQKTNTFDGVIGFFTDNITGKIAFNGNVNLKLENSFNTGETFLFNWNRPVAGNQTLTLLYSQPYMFKSLFGFDFSFDLYKQDSSYVNVTNNIVVPYRFTPDRYIMILGKYFSSQLSSGNNDTMRKNIVNIAFGLGLVFNTLDNKINPRRGIAIEATLEAGNKRLNNNELNSGDKSSVDAVFTFGGKWFIPVFKNSAFLIENKSAGNYSPVIVENELFRIGGLKSLRGFDEQSIRVSAYSIFNLEYRLLYSRNSFLSVFYNAAWVERKLETAYSTDIPMGFGAGFSFDTGGGIISLYYAIGKQQNNPFNLNESKIHFGYLIKF